MDTRAHTEDSDREKAVLHGGGKKAASRGTSFWVQLEGNTRGVPLRKGPQHY